MYSFSARSLRPHPRDARSQPNHRQARSGRFEGRDALFLDHSFGLPCLVYVVRGYGNQEIVASKQAAFLSGGTLCVYERERERVCVCMREREIVCVYVCA